MTSLALGALGGVLGALTVLFLRDHSTPSPAAWAATIAAIGLLLNAGVWYLKSVAKHCCRLMPESIAFTGEQIEFKFLLANSGTRHLALEQLYLSVKFGPAVSPAWVSVLDARGELPLIVQPGEMRHSRASFRYQPKAIYEDNQVGVMNDDGLKEVSWKLGWIVTDSTGRSHGAGIRGVDFWSQTLSADEPHSRSNQGSVLYPITLVDHWEWFSFI